MSGQYGGVDYERSWKLRLRRRLYDQFKSKPGLVAIADLLARQAQDLEDALQQLFTIMDIGDGVRTDVTGQVIGVGAQLRLIGRIVGQPYAGEGDDIYRYRLRARIQANRSSGDGESIYRVFVALLGGAGALYTTRVGTAALLLRIGSVAITPAVAGVALDFLRDSKLAGVRAWLEYQQQPDADTFCFAKIGGADPDVGKGWSDTAHPTAGGQWADAALVI